MDIVFIILVLFVILGLFVSANASGNKEKMNSLLESKPTHPSELSFKSTDTYLEQYGENGIAVDGINRRFAFLSPQMKTVVSYGQIVQSEVCVDSEIIIKTDRTGQIGGAMLGGMLTGGVGALIGALGAKKKQVKNIRRVELKIIVSGNYKSTYIILFGSGSGFIAEHAIRDASKWHDLLSVAIKEHSDSMQMASSKQSSQLTSVADELNKYADLLSRGLISDDEFKQAKAALLSS